jgi:hypothetical protein
LLRVYASGYFWQIKTPDKSTGLPQARVYNERSVLVRVVNMKRSRTEVGRWRMLRQTGRRKARWLEAQSRRNMRIHAIRKCSMNRHRNALLFAVQDY